MSQTESTYTRNLIYSVWHRVENIRRYLGPVRAAQLTQIDIDWCEYCCYCKTPVALIETQVSDRPPKQARVTGNLANMAVVPAYSVSVVCDDMDQITRFIVQQIAPSLGYVLPMLPQEYALWLLSLRTEHDQSGRCSRQADTEKESA
jgi:hypothetical protein